MYEQANHLHKLQKLEFFKQVISKNMSQNITIPEPLMNPEGQKENYFNCNN